MCCIPPECNDAYSDERRFRQEVLRMLSCLFTTNIQNDTEVLSLCDVQTSGEVISFIRKFVVSCDGTVTISDFEIDGETPYVVTGEVVNCGTIGHTDLTSATFFDEMWGVLSGSWATRVSTGSRDPMTKDNGWIDFTTGAVTTNEESVDFNDYLMFSASKYPAFYTRIQLPDISDVEVAIGLIGLATNDYIRFFYSDASGVTNWRVQTSDAGTTSSVTTSSPVTTDEVELYWVFASATQIDFYIDGVLAGSIGVNVPVNSLQPYIAVVTETNAAKELYVDYVKIVQDRT